MGWVLAVCVGLTLLGVGWQRQQGGLVPDDGGPLVWQSRLHFEDRANGDIGVLDATGREVARFSGEQGFLRISLRTLARERLRQGLGPQAPFELTGHANGRLSLRDPATGVRIPLESFGPTQVALFAQLKPNAAGAAASPIDQGKQP
jgi:putative photosynthetic complex assembly protein